MKNMAIEEQFVKTLHANQTAHVQSSSGPQPTDIFGGAKLCNLLLYLTNTYVCENFGAAIARLPPSGCGPDRYI